MNKTLKLSFKIHIAILFLFPLKNIAQIENLVYNPGFEDFKKCPEGYTFQDKSHKLIPYWTYPTLTTPDYFNKCSNGIVKVPSNFAGVAEANSGNAYMGAILSGSEMNYREYIQGELKEALIAGQKYCVTFHYRLASFSKFAVDQLSLLFISEKIENESKAYLQRKPQINNVSGLFLDNSNRWEQICRVFVAEGNEKFFVIGNFKPYAGTNYVVTDKNITNKRDKAYSYYYFDDFAVRPLVDCDICPCVQHGLESVIVHSNYTGGVNPISGFADKIINDGKIEIKIFGGVEPYLIKWSDGLTGTKLSNLPAGKYSYTVTDANSCISEGFVEFAEPELKQDPLTEGLRNIEEGEAIILENLFFETGKNTLLEKSYVELDKLLELMNEIDIELIEISGHTDSEGSEEFNQKLSEGRAQSVVNYLVEKGINETQLLVAGYGESKPIDTNLNPSGQTQNRRVEFKVLKK